MSKPYMIMYGNYSLSNKRFNLNSSNPYDSASIDVQVLPIARGRGSAVVNTKQTDKIIDTNGIIKAHTSNIQDQILEFDKITNYQDSYFRVVPDYEFISETQSTSGWAASDDAANLALDTSKYQWLDKSIGFDIDISASGNDYATLTYSSTAIDLSTHTNTGNFEFWVNIPYVNDVTSIDLRVGTNSSNYYEVSGLNTDYQGKTFVNGWLALSIPWTTSTPQVGTVNASSIGYVRIKVNHSSATDINGCNIGGVWWANEDRLRNYPTYNTNQITRPIGIGKVEFVNFNAKFLNYKGYAIGTHSISLFNALGISSNSDNQIFDLEGSLNTTPLFNVKINTASDIESFSILNNNNSQSLGLLPSSLSNGDLIIFGSESKINTKNNTPLDFDGVIPDFDLGKNSVNLNIVGSSSLINIPSSIVVKNNNRANFGSTPGPDYRYISQSFTTINGNDISSVSFDISNPTLGSGGSLKWYITTDNAGKPSSTILYDSNFYPTTGQILATGLSIPVSSATVYHLVVTCYRYNTNATALTWDCDTSNVYADGAVNTSSKNTSLPPAFASLTWTGQTGDQVFRITQAPSPSWDVDWSASYKKIYKS